MISERTWRGVPVEDSRGTAFLVNNVGSLADPEER